MEIFVILGILAAYFFPTIIAIQRKHNNHTPIFISNLFLGWTAIGWVITLIWSITDNVKAGS